MYATFYGNLGAQNALRRKHNFLNIGAQCLFYVNFSITLTEVITDVALTAKLQGTRVSNDDDERRCDEAARLLIVSGARRKLYVNRVMERRFGYNWISLVRYCKYWQAGKLPTQ
jgi:hypothetical protein